MIEEHGIKSKRSQGLIDHAYSVAKKHHEGQQRKYTGKPYIVHPVEVAQIVSTVTDCCYCICAALLHDVIEDCGATVESLNEEGFGFGISTLVLELTDFSVKSDGNRATRKELDRRYLSRVSNKAKTVKLADLISNSKSIAEHDPKFAKTYMKEKKLLLEVLVGGNEILYKQAKQIVDDYYKEEK